MDAKFIFLDTEIFVQQNFQYNIGLLAAFRHKVQNGQIHLITTEITLNEVNRRIEISLKEAENALNSFRTKARILRNIQSPHIVRVFKKLSRKKLLRELREQFDNYIDELKPTILTTDSVQPSTVFSQYFKSLPPFHQTKKKSEFPDAFAMEALKIFCNNKNSKVMIVSADPEWQEVANNNDCFEFEERLDQLLHKIQEETPLIENAKIVIDKLSQQIESMFKDEFLSMGFFVADREAVVKDVTIDDIYHREYFIVDIREDEIIFSMDVNVSFNALVEYSMNKVDRYRQFYPERIPPEELYGYESLAVIGTINWNPSNIEISKVKEINISNPRNIPLFVEDFYGS